MAQWVKNLPAMREDTEEAGLIPGSEDPLEEGMVPYFNILAWRISWTKEPGGLQAKGLQRVGHD